MKWSHKVDEVQFFQVFIGHGEEFRFYLKHDGKTPECFKQEQHDGATNWDKLLVLGTKDSGVSLGHLEANLLLLSEFHLACFKREMVRLYYKGLF